MPRYLETNEQHDVLVSLREVLAQLKRTDEDVNSWKWALIALACAINGALTCNLSGTMQVGALHDRKVKQTIAALQEDSAKEIPEPWLASPTELLRRSKTTERIERSGRNLAISLSLEESFGRLFGFRDQFIHFKPSGWAIEVTGMPQIFYDVVGIIGMIVEDGWSFRHLDEANIGELSEVYDAIVLELKRIGEF